MEQIELQKILAAHKAWINDKPDGVRADLSEADLSGVAGCLSAQSPTSCRVTFFHPESDYVQSGCRKTDLAGFKAAVAETYPDTESKARRGYEAIISLFEVYAVAVEQE